MSVEHSLHSYFYNAAIKDQIERKANPRLPAREFEEMLADWQRRCGRKYPNANSEAVRKLAMKCYRNYKKDRRGFSALQEAEHDLNRRLRQLALQSPTCKAIESALLIWETQERFRLTAKEQMHLADWLEGVRAAWPFYRQRVRLMAQGLWSRERKSLQPEQMQQLLRTLDKYHLRPRLPLNQWRMGQFNRVMVAFTYDWGDPASVGDLVMPEGAQQPFWKPKKRPIGKIVRLRRPNPQVD